MNQTKINYLSDLQELVTFGESKLGSHTFSLSEHRTRKVLVFQYTGAAHGLMQPFIDLCTAKRTSGATILIRSLFEVYVRLIFIFCEKGQQNVVKGIRESFRKKAQSTKDWDKFLHDNPNLGKGFDIARLMKEVPNWEKYQKKAEKIFNQRYGHSDYKWPSLNKMVEQIDNWNNLHHPAKRHKNNLTWTYLTVYGLWSQLVHLDFDGLNSLMKPASGGGFEFMFEGHPEDVDKLCISAYAFYFKILDIFSNQFGTPTRSDLKQYRDVMKSYNKKI